MAGKTGSQDQPATERVFNAARRARSLWFTAPRTVELRDHTLPPPGPGEVTVEAICSGVSHGTEKLVLSGEVPAQLELDLTLPTQQGSFDFPIKYGYSCVGRVLETGNAVSELRVGDLVFAFNPHETLFNIRADCAIRLADGTKPERAVFLAGIETAINALLDASPRIGERILVLGQGVIGLLIAQLAVRSGAGRVVTVDPLENRRRLSQSLGVTAALDPAVDDVTGSIQALFDGAGADVVIEATGRPEVLELATSAAEHEGRIVVVSWYGERRAMLNLGEHFHRKRLTIKSSQVSRIDPALGLRWTLERRRRLAAEYVSALQLDPLVTHTFAFEEAESAYALVMEHPEDAVQVLFRYKQQSPVAG